MNPVCHNCLWSRHNVFNYDINYCEKGNDRWMFSGDTGEPCTDFFSIEEAREIFRESDKARKSMDKFKKALNEMIRQKEGEKE